jgi:hypothetical protein
MRLYEAVTSQWQSIGPRQEKNFGPFRDRRHAIDKDVARTDRTHPAFAGDQSPKLVALRRILLGYSLFNFDIGYCQGMSDLLAVLLLVYDAEWEAFAVFAALMEKCAGNFSDGANHTIAKQLQQVEVLVRGFMPRLYTHLQQVGATSMSFCFRWLLVLFKREFYIDEVPRLWDGIFMCPFTPTFEIVLVAALLRSAGEQIVDHSMGFDELIKFTNRLCSVTDVDTLLQLGLEFYQFVAEQYVWSQQQQQLGGAASSGVGAGLSDLHSLPSLKEVVAVYEKVDM